MAMTECIRLGVQIETASTSGSAENVVVVRHGGAAAVLFHSGPGPLRDDVAEILDLRVRIVEIRRNVGAVGNGAAPDNGDDNFAHNKNLL